MADRSVTVRLRGDADDLVSAVRRAEREVRRLDMQVADFARQHPTATVGVNTAEAERRLAKMRSQVDRIGAAHARAAVDVDAGKAQADLAAVDAELDHIDGQTARARVDVDTSGAQRRFSMLTSAMLGLGPALAPIGAVAAAGLMGAAGAAGALTAGLGTAALASRGVTDALKALQAAHDAAGKSASAQATAEANLAVAMGNLSVRGREFATFLYGLKPHLDALTGTAQAGLFPGLEVGLARLDVLFPQVDRLVGATADELGRLAAEGGAAMDSPRWRDFFGFLSAEAGPVLDDFGHVVGDLADGFAGLLEGFAPVERDLGAGLRSLSADFARWGQSLRSSQAFADFIGYVRENGPVVAHTLGDIGAALVAVLHAGAGIGPDVLRAVDGIARAVTVIASTPAVGPALVGMAAALGALNLALRAFDAAKASRLVGILAGLRGGGVAAAGIGRLSATAGAAAIAIPVLSAAVDELHRALAPAPPDVDRLTTSLENLAVTGRAGGEVTRLFGKDLSGFADELGRIVDPSVLSRIGDVGTSIAGWLSFNLIGNRAGNVDLRQDRKDFQALDQTLTDMVTGGNLQQAQQLFGLLAAKAHEQGLSTKQLVSILPDYSTALDRAAADARAAGDYARAYAIEQGKIAENTRSATVAMMEQNNQLHAAMDPLFALADALSSQAQAQAAAAEAARKYGASSAEAKAANLDLATSALTVTDAAQKVAAGMADGSITVDKARQMLSQWVIAGQLTEGQAQQVAATLGVVINKAGVLSRTPAVLHAEWGTVDTAGEHLNAVSAMMDLLNGKTSTLHVHADVGHALAGLQSIQAWLNTIHSKTIDITTRENVLQSGPGHMATVPHYAPGGRCGVLFEPQAVAA